MDTGTNIDSELENEGMEQTEILMFDTSSGISEEEQREILGRIDAITAQNRMSPSPATLKVQAKKQGSLFPVLVNIAALFLLGGGLFLLFTAHQQDTLKFRQESPYFGTMEQQVIREIRRETLESLRAKDQEIASIMDRLAQIDRDIHNLQNLMDKRLQEKEAELREQINREIEEERRRLIEKNISEIAIVEGMRIFEEQKEAWLKAELIAFKKQLDAEQLASKAQLEKLREEYQHTLAQLQTERVQILEAAHVREESLQTQLREKTRELNTLYQQSQQDLGAVMDEIHQMTNAWEQSVLIEREMSGFYTTLNNQIREEQLPEAAKTLAAMREFLNTPGFQNLSPLQSRKEFYLASLNVLSEIIEGGVLRNPPKESSIPVLPDAPESRVVNRDYENTIAELKAQNLALERIIGEREQTIANFNSRSSSQRQASGNYENTISTLRQQNASLQQTLTARDSSISTLRTQNTSLQQIVTAHEITIKEFRTQNAGLQQAVSAHEITIDDLKTQNTGLQQTMTARDSAINTLRTQNTSLSQTVNTRDNTITELRTQNTSLQQTLNTRDSTISELRTQNNTLQQTVEQLRQTNDAVRKLLNNQ